MATNNLLEKQNEVSLYICMPAYNEEGIIEKTIKDWYPILEGKAEESRLVIADFGSNDNTRDILEDMKNNGYPQLEILNNENQFHVLKYWIYTNMQLIIILTIFFKQILMGKLIQMNLMIFGI